MGLSRSKPTIFGYPHDYGNPHLCLSNIHFLFVLGDECGELCTSAMSMGWVISLDMSWTRTPKCCSTWSFWTQQGLHFFPMLSTKMWKTHGESRSEHDRLYHGGIPMVCLLHFFRAETIAEGADSAEGSEPELYPWVP